MTVEATKEAAGCGVEEKQHEVIMKETKDNNGGLRAINNSTMLS